ncbi:MAG TPA: DNA repair protein RecN, partial [Protaetiibacter sp.]|nr:DNA repair protein RecN [Protaetiibacter sp.]
VVARHVEIYAQHAQHSLLGVAGQRAALDRYAGTDLDDLHEARRRLKAIEDELASLGGDLASREREAELLRFQLAELDEAALEGPDEDDRLAAEQAALGDVAADRARAATALAALTDDSGAAEALGNAVGALGQSDVFAADHRRISGLAAELSDAASELRRRAETIAEDPERLEAVTQRRQLLATLRRRHGDGTLAGVIAEHTRLADRLAELEHADERSVALMDQLEQARSVVARAAAEVAAVRRMAAPELSRRVQAELQELAMPAASFTLTVGAEDPGDDVEMRFTANPGTTPAPLARVASGGELARAMLALRLVATADQDTVIFDEVDAGIGGTAAIAVGDALRRLGRTRQVFVVTHLAQVAAAADHQIGVSKSVAGGTTRTRADALDGEARVVELSRMLSGQPSSDSARTHARELLASAGGAGPR